MMINSFSDILSYFHNHFMAFSFVHGARIFGFAKIPVNGNKFFQLQETSPNDFLQADFVKM